MNGSKRYIGLFLLSFALMKCGIEDMNFSLTGWKQTDLDYEEYPPIPPKPIALFSSTSKLIRSHHSMHPDSVLFALYPAPLPDSSMDYNDMKTVAYWNCPTCAVDSLQDWNNADGAYIPTIAFPFSQNFTEVVGELTYADNQGKTNRLYAFSTAEYNDGTGRFTGGVLALANFRQHGNQWDMTRYNPSVNYQGKFTRSDGPDTAIIFKNKTYFIGVGGLANGVSVEEYWPLFSDVFIYDESLNQVIRLNFYECALNCEKGTNYATEITSIDYFKGTYCVETLTKGELLAGYYWGGPRGINEAMIEELLKNYAWLRFEFVQTFQQLQLQDFEQRSVLKLFDSEGNLVKEITEINPYKSIQ